MKISSDEAEVANAIPIGMGKPGIGKRSRIPREIERPTRRNG
jgi:hypothetical protein